MNWNICNISNGFVTAVSPLNGAARPDKGTNSVCQARALALCISRPCRDLKTEDWSDAINNPSHSSIWFAILDVTMVLCQHQEIPVISVISATLVSRHGGQGDWKYTQTCLLYWKYLRIKGNEDLISSVFTLITNYLVFIYSQSWYCRYCSVVCFAW